MESADNPQKWTETETHEIIQSAPLASPDSPDPLRRQNKSFMSVTSSSSGSGFGKGKEITETIAFKIFQLRWLYISIAWNTITLVAGAALTSKDGMYLGFGGAAFQQSSPVFFELWMILAHIWTYKAFTDSMAAYFGYLLASKKGYSIVVCGFVQGSLLDQITFGSKLSFRSMARKPLTRLGILVAIHSAVLVMAMFAPTQVSGEKFRIDYGTLSCLEFDQELDPFDRGWPTVEVEMVLGPLWVI
jgi:hypothetical protein